MAALLGAVGRDEVGPSLRREADGDHGRGRGDKAIHHHRPAVGRGGQCGSRQAADLKATDLCQHVQRVGGIGPVDEQGALHGVHLAGQASVVHAGAPPHELGRGAPGQSGSDGGRGRGVADAHVTHAQDVQPTRQFGLDHFYTGHHSLESLFPAHGRPTGDVAAARRDLCVHQVGMGLQVGDHAHVHDHDPRPHVPGQDVDRRAAVEKIEHHLGRDLLGIGADSLGDHAVVPGHGDDNLVPDLGQRLAQDAGQLNREALQPAQAAPWLGQAVLTGTGGHHSGFIQRPNLSDDVCELHLFFSPCNWSDKKFPLSTGQREKPDAVMRRALIPFHEVAGSRAEVVGLASTREREKNERFR